MSQTFWGKTRTKTWNAVRNLAATNPKEAREALLYLMERYKEPSKRICMSYAFKHSNVYGVGKHYVNQEDAGEAFFLDFWIKYMRNPWLLSPSSIGDKPYHSFFAACLHNYLRDCNRELESVGRGGIGRGVTPVSDGDVVGQSERDEKQATKRAAHVSFDADHGEEPSAEGEVIPLPERVEDSSIIPLDEWAQLEMGLEDLREALIEFLGDQDIKPEERALWLTALKEDGTSKKQIYVDLASLRRTEPESVEVLASRWRKSYWNDYVPRHFALRLNSDDPRLVSAEIKRLQTLVMEARKRTRP